MIRLNAANKLSASSLDAKIVILKNIENACDARSLKAPLLFTRQRASQRMISAAW